LRGIRVVDFSRVLAGPWASQHLADQGADVVKVEAPGGDETRGFAPHVRGVSTYYLSCNRNKRSIVLDLHTDAGQGVAKRLVAGADVFVHNWRPGVAERVGLGWADLADTHPRLVHVHLCAFGSEGDPRWTGRAGYDLVLQAMGGAMSFTGAPDGPPVRSGTPIADLVAGLLVCNAVLHGLLERERSGRGQRIEVNMMQAQAASLAYHASRYTLTGEAEVRRGNAHRGLVPYDVYTCKDGRLAVACGNDGIWRRLRSALAIPDVERWRTNPGRVACREEVDAAVSAALAGLTVAEADARLAAADVPAGPVLDVAEVVAHPAVDMVDVPHPVLGATRLVGPILRTATTVGAHRAPPALGADRDAILRDAGYDPGEIGRLAEAGAFGRPATWGEE
jgi:crotonobetainyl-CoA:carnitine CoA-transferase CaiB-like acyl-CoA transferase